MKRQMYKVIGNTLAVTHIKVLFNPLWVNTLGNDHHFTVYLKTDKDLGSRLAVLLGNVHYLGILQDGGVTRFGPGPVWGPQGTVRSEDYSMTLAVLNERFLVEVRMALHL